MATLRRAPGEPRAVRRGLPRVPGGDPWPPAGAGPAPPADAPAPPADAPAPPADAPVSPAAEPGHRALRRGLPRVPGGEPWPDAGSVADSSPVVERESAAPETKRAESTTPVREPVESSSDPSTGSRSGHRALRRGLPRTSGGDPWPPAGFAPIAASILESPSTGSGTGEDPQPVDATAVAKLDAPLPFTPTVFPTAGAARWNADRARAAGTAPLAPPEPKRYGPFTRLQWAGAVIVAGAGLLFAAGMVVLATRWFLSLEFMQEFLAAYPGEYHLPEGAPIGIPAWLGWQHFFNVFLMVLIIRSGWQVRTEKRPTAFWSPRTNKRRKISLNLWFHQSLDILWLVNGVIFVVLLFATGQWMKIVPTSWAVIPNAISAALQYVSLDWPTENGWVNYNSLQQLAYFATVFIAAPLAALTGVRMSGIWPKNATGLNKAYPVEWARAVHFPVMIYFVLFIVAHVTLVLATGALRNLNHMYASQGSVDPNAYADNWAGFWIFTASLVVIIAGWIAARPLVLAPIARLFGTVSGR